jgi:hypothetical protein
VCSRICSSRKDVDDLLARLKLTPCPHCKIVGALIRHGFLRGYDQNHQRTKTVRAARVFCSNRHRATGCGRTFSVWIADRIKHLYLSADSLWQFLSGAANPGNKLRAFRELDCGLSDSAPYHIWRRFLNAQSAIRTALAGLCEPPRMVSDCPVSDCPVRLTLAHLAQAFKEHPLSPIAAFGAVLQTFFI